MILGVDHLALSCVDVVATAGELAKSGFWARFVELALPNRPVKRSFLREYHPVHSIAYCVADAGPAIELTDHHTSLREAASPYQVLLTGSPTAALPLPNGDGAWGWIWSEAIGCVRPVVAVWPPLQARVWYDAAKGGEGSTQVRAVLVPSPALDSTEAFWENGLGCRVVGRGGTTGGRWTRVAFDAPVPGWSLDVTLAETWRASRLPLLDDAGFPCLALLSTDLDRDGERLWKAGALASSGEFTVDVNGKVLRVAVFRGPSAELIELLDVQRGS